MDSNKSQRCGKLRQPIVTCLALALGLLLLISSGVKAAETASATASAAGDLNLSTAQQQKLSALETASRAQASQLTERIKLLRSKLASLYRTYTLNPEDAKRLNGELNSVQGQLLDLRLGEQTQLRAILSADQFAQLQAAIANDRSWSGHHGHGRGSTDLERGQARHS